MVVDARPSLRGQTRYGSTGVFDLWSRGSVSGVWIQLGCQETDKVSVVSRATGSDQLWASRAETESCLRLFPAMGGCVCLYRGLVMPAVFEMCLRWIQLSALRQHFYTCAIVNAIQFRTSVHVQHCLLVCYFILLHFIFTRFFCFYWCFFIRILCPW